MSSSPKDDVTILTGPHNVLLDAGPFSQVGLAPRQRPIGTSAVLALMHVDGVRFVLEGFIVFLGYPTNGRVDLLGLW
jgi:hypothetical protein